MVLVNLFKYVGVCQSTYVCRCECVCLCVHALQGVSVFVLVLLSKCRNDAGLSGIPINPE
jgi:hypothetical protein